MRTRSWLFRLLRRNGLVWVGFLLVACAHQGVDSTAEISQSEETSETQLQALVGAAQSEMSNQEVPAEVSDTASDTEQSLETEGVKNTDELAAKSSDSIEVTDSLVAEMQPEPVVESVTGQALQGQEDISLPFESKPLMVANASKVRLERKKNETKLEPAPVPEAPASLPAESEKREPGSVEYPASATVVPSADAETLNEAPPPLMEPTSEDDIKSEVEREKVLANPEIGGVIMRPWFPWVAIFMGCVGFVILGYLRFKKRKASGS